MAVLKLSPCLAWLQMMSMKEQHISRLETSGAAPMDDSARAADSQLEPRPPGTPDPALQDALFSFLLVLKKGSGQVFEHPNPKGRTITYMDIKQKHKVAPALTTMHTI